MGNCSGDERYDYDSNFSPSMPLNSYRHRQSFVRFFTTDMASECRRGGTIMEANSAIYILHVKYGN